MERLRLLYEEALNTEDVIGLVIGTRPDCLQPDILHYLECLSRQTFLVVELGIESTNDNTLLRINRGHDYACSQQAVEALASRGIQTGGHIILGLPGEDKTEQLRQAHEISRLPLTLLKIHQLQIIKGTRMARDYEEGKIKSMEADEYLHTLAHYISRLRENLVLERFFSSSPLNKVVSPRWGLKPDILTQMLCQYMREQQLWQGKASII